MNKKVDELDLLISIKEHIKEFSANVFELPRDDAEELIAAADIIPPGAGVEDVEERRRS